MSQSGMETGSGPGETCLRCGGAMVAGTIGTLEGLAFSTPASGFLSLGSASEVEAACCQECGRIELRVSNPERFRKRPPGP